MSSLNINTQNSYPVFSETFGTAGRKQKNKITPESVTKQMSEANVQREKESSEKCEKTSGILNKIAGGIKTVGKFASYIPIVGPIIGAVCSFVALGVQGAGNIAKAAGSKHEKRAGEIADASAKAISNLEEGGKASKKVFSKEGREAARAAFQEKQAANHLHATTIKNAHAEKLMAKAEKLADKNPAKAEKLKERALGLTQNLSQQAASAEGAAKDTLTAMQDIPQVAVS